MTSNAYGVSIWPDEMFSIACRDDCNSMKILKNHRIIKCLF